MRLGILTYDDSPPIGGLGIVARQYRDALLELDPSMSITMISPAPASDELVCRWMRSRYRRRWGCPLFSCIFAIFGTRLLRRLQCDVLLVHAGSGGVFLLWKPPCPVVVLAHHTYDDEAALVYKRHPWLACRKRLMGLLERRTYRLADRVIAVSSDTADSIARQGAVARHSITVLENPVDPLWMSLRHQPMDPLTLLAIGRLEPRKGTDVLLSAFQIVRRSMPSVTLVLAGLNLMGDDLGRLLDEYQLHDAVTILGHIEHADRIRLMQSATVMVVPSLLEGFGLVAAEAMAMGLPVVASSSPGLRSIIEHDRTGLLSPPGDASGLASQLCRMLSDVSLRSRLGLAASADARRRFDRTTQARRLMDMLRSAAHHPSV